MGDDASVERLSLLKMASLMSLTDSSESLTVTRDRTSILSKEFDENSTDVNVTDSLFNSMTVTDVSSEQVITKDMINKKQLQHDLELARIELVQRNLMIDSIKAEYLSKIDELEERVSDEMHQKQLLTVQFQNQLRASRQELKMENERLKNDVANLLKHQKNATADNDKLMRKAIECKEVLSNLEIDENEYHTMKGKTIEDQTLWELIAVKFFEALKPLKIQCSALQSRLELVAMEMSEKDDELANAMKDLEEERKARTELDIRCQRLNINLEDLRDQVKRKDYKKDNFDTIRSERDQLESELLEIRKNLSVTQALLETKTSESDTLQNELADLRQSVMLLKQDKSYLSKELVDLKPRYDLLEEKVKEKSKMLEDARNAKEEYYERFVTSRDRYKLEYEERLRREIDELSKKTGIEIEKIKNSSQEIYERENRALREGRDDALAEKKRFELAAKEADDRHRELVSEFKQLQLSSESRIAEAYNGFKLKSFELERVQLVLEERGCALKKSNMENEKLSKQKEELSKEYNSLLLSTNKRITELESRELEFSKKLAVYEKMEDELDNVIMQAAEVSDDQEAERVLFSYGYGANIPSTAKRRMQQSVHLAKRVLQLERLNTSLRQENENERIKNSNLSKELSSTTNLLSEAKQPHNYLIESIKVRDDENKRIKDTLGSLTDDLERLRRENKSLKKLNDQMTLDLERLLNQKEEMNVLKQVVLGMKSSDEPVRHRVEFCRKTAATKPSGNEKSLNVNLNPVMSETPSWYSKLKFQNSKGTNFK